MSLLDKINEDLKTSMKSGDRARVEVLRFAISGIRNVEKEKFAKQPGVALTDEEVVATLQKDAKRRKEAIELFKKGGRNDLVEKEEGDLKIIMSYLPQELSEDELGKIVEEVKAQGNADFNSIMRETMKLVKGRADGRMVGEVIKKKLG